MTLWVALLIVHGLVAVALTGAITHQLVSLCWSPRKRRFPERFASVQPAAFTRFVVGAYLVNFTLGAWIYTHYRYTVKGLLEDIGLFPQVGLFELKEHAAAIALLLLPAYWYYWRWVPSNERKVSRAGVTGFVAFSVWLSFLGGHIVNNARGF